MKARRSQAEPLADNPSDQEFLEWVVCVGLYSFVYAVWMAFR